MAQHHHSRRAALRYGAAVASTLLTLATRRRHHPGHRRGRGRHPLTGGRFGPSHHLTGRRGRRRGRWSR